MLIDKYEGVRANWAPDIIGRAYGNRGDRHLLFTRICPSPFYVEKRNCNFVHLTPATVQR